jgi:GT2 family glycosyltransferase
MTPSISIFIVNYNTCSLLEQCLQSIFDTKGDISVEVFVADNSSTDGSPEMIESEFPQVLLTRYSQNVGYVRAINPLLPLANGKYFLLLHPDVEILTNTLNRFIEFFESHSLAGILGANLYYPDGTPNPSEVLFPNFKNEILCFALRLFRRLPGGKNLAGKHNPLEWSHKSTSQVNWVWNACMIVRREVLQSIGYFDEDFYVWYADWDLCKRAADAGWLVYYVHPAIAIHYERQSFSKADIPREEVRYKVDGWRSVMQQTRDRQTFLKKHSNPASIYGMRIVGVLENVLRLWLIVGSLVFRRADSREATFQLRMCLRTIQAILST